MRIQLLIMVTCLSKVMTSAALTITNGPQNTTVCVNQFASISCGCTGADPNVVVPNWHIIKRNTNGAIVSNETINGTEINRDTNDGLEWIADPLNGNNSVLRVGPAVRADDQSSYQCSFMSSNDTIISSVGMLTVLDPPSIDSISAGFTNDTTITIRWASSSAVSYSVLISYGDVTTAFTTSNTQYTIHGVVRDTPYRISVVPRNQLCQGEGAHATVSTGTAPVITRSTAMTTTTMSGQMITPTMTMNAQGGNDSDDQRRTTIIIIIVCVVVTLVVVVVAVIAVICVKHHYKLTFGNCSHHDDQNEGTPNTAPSSTYIPLSDDNPTPQDTYPVDHDGVHGD